MAHLKPGDFVNIRSPEIAGGGKVKLKERERDAEMIGWDDKLTLEFNGRRPALRSLAIAPADVPTVFLTDDSTVCDQPAEPWGSWGQMLPRFFGPAVAVANCAQSGESIRSSLGAGRFDKVFSLMKRGDYHFIQFGHHNNYGSYLLAKCVIAGIQQANLPLAKAIVADFGDFEPAKPDPASSFDVPASPVVSNIKTQGN